MFCCQIDGVESRDCEDHILIGEKLTRIGTESTELVEC